MTETSCSDTPAEEDGGEDASADSSPVAAFRMEDQAGHLLRRAYQRSTAVFGQLIADPHLTPPQFATLLKLMEFGQASQNELGRRAGMDPATSQGVVRRLYNRRLIEREKDPTDKRRTVWRLTPAGRRLVEQTIENVRSQNDVVLAPLDPAERRTLLTLLRRLVCPEPASPDADP